MDLKSYIGLGVRQARKRKGITQAQLAEAINRTFETVSNIERGKTAPGLQTLAEICAVLGVPLGELVADADAPGKSRSRIEQESVARHLITVMDDRTLKTWTEIGLIMAEAGD